MDERLHVRVLFERVGRSEHLEPRYAVWEGLYGNMYNFSFNDLMNVICVRQGRVQKRLEYRR